MQCRKTDLDDTSMADYDGSVAACTSYHSLIL